MTNYQKAAIAGTIAVSLSTAVYQTHETFKLRSHIEKMTEDQALLDKQIAQLQDKLNLALSQLTPISARTATALPAAIADVAGLPSSKPSNRILQILNATNWPSLSAGQVDHYLTQNGRSAASLLAIFRANGDPSLLEEALQKYPKDPQVNFAAIFRENGSPEEKQQSIKAFKEAAPDNALANYLSALDYLKSGQSAEAVKELTAAASKTDFKDYSMSFRQNAEEAYRSAGYSEAEAKVIASHSLLMPHLVELNRFGTGMVGLANDYRQAGDDASAQNALQLGVSVGQRIERSSEDPSLTTQLLGASIERQSLRAMDPTTPVGNSGQIATDRLDELLRQRTSIQELSRQFEGIQGAMTPEDWIAYNDRAKGFGEADAMQWFVSRSVSK